MNEIQYLPGVCNIGPAEVARRRRLGWAGVVVAIGFAALCVWIRAPRLWRTLVFVPAFLSAAGFLQSRYRFCSGYAARGVYNFGAPGQTRSVPDEASRRIDRRKGNRILMISVLIAAVVTLLATMIM